MTNNQNSRTDKYEKRRRNTKLINYSIALASALILFLVVIWIFGGGTDEVTETTGTESNDEESFFLDVSEEESESDESIEQEEEIDENTENLIDEEEDTEEQVDSDEEIITTEAEPSDDNVKEAITGNWPPIGTSQSGPHTTKFENGSQDRIEIKQAVSMATGISEDNLVEWWVGNGGDQKVIATVSDGQETETYRVFLSWVDNEGWQPTKIETLIENDKKRQ